MAIVFICLWDLTFSSSGALHPFEVLQNLGRKLGAKTVPQLQRIDALTAGQTARDLL